MKKISLLIITLCFSVLFCGCSSVSGDDISTAVTQIESSTTQNETQSSAQMFTDAPTQSQQTATSVTSQVSTTAHTTTTTQAPTSQLTQKTEPVENVCSISIECKNILENKASFNKDKSAFLPDDGIIVQNMSVPILAQNEDGKPFTAFDALKWVCKNQKCKSACAYCEKGIQLEYNFTPAFGSYYIEGIHQLYEFDCGSESGWMYSVNGTFPDVACSEYEVKSGDNIVFSYTCNTGIDLGNAY